jgi:DNA-binding MarR family transcriptional regulator
LVVPPRRVKKTKPTASIKEPTKKASWTFLSNYAHVLIVLSNDDSMVLREVAVKVGITERAVQRIVADLEQDGFIEREKIGRKNHYRILNKRPLRHPLEAHRTIGDLIAAIHAVR